MIQLSWFDKTSFTIPSLLGINMVQGPGKVNDHQQSGRFEYNQSAVTTKK
jgi:hypothetical protein